jgi:Sec-independent protein secretion pathway component TatC
VTLLLEMVPLLVLYELSIQVARLVAPRPDADSVPAT